MTAVASQVARKLGVVGKGGVGKTTVCGLLARAYADRGRSVVAIDTDSNPNLGLSLGLSFEETEAVPVLPRSVVVGSGGGADSSTLLQEYGRPTPAGPVLLSAIKVAAAGAGCTCSGHATVRSLLGDALVGVDLALVDMEAGLEHLSRGTGKHVSRFLAVVEPYYRSMETARRVAELAAELGITTVGAVLNKVRDEADREAVSSYCAAHAMTIVGEIPYDASLADAERAGTPPLDYGPDAPAIAAMRRLADGLMNVA